MRELDREVAEKVMGWSIWKKALYPPIPTNSGIPPGSKSLEPVEAPNYSTSISDAWLVVERMMELGWQYCELRSELNDVWICLFRKEIEDEPIHIGYFTEPVAKSICLAALRALETGLVKKEE